MPKPAILVVDDEPDICELLSITLQRMDLSPRTANTVAAAQRLLKAERFDLCLTDMQLTDGDGLELVKWIQQYTPSVPVAVITAHGNMETAVRALKLGAFDFVSKPLDLAGLRKLVAAAIKLSGAIETDTSVFGPRLLGTSAAMQHMREMIGRIDDMQHPSAGFQNPARFVKYPADFRGRHMLQHVVGINQIHRISRMARGSRVRRSVIRNPALLQQFARIRLRFDQFRQERAPIRQQGERSMTF